MLKNLRLKIVFLIADLLYVPIKIRESFWLGDDPVTTEDNCSGQSGGAT